MFHVRFRQGAAVQLLMLANAVFFASSALLHLGVPLGPLSESRIVAAAAVESICALGLIAGVAALVYAPRGGMLAAFVANVVALAGVATGVIAVALGAGERTLSNDLGHLIMTLLALAALWLLVKNRFREE